MAEIEQEIARAAAIREDTVNRERNLAGYFTTILGTGALVAVVGWVLFRGDDCFQTVVDSQFATDSNRFANKFDSSSGCTQDKLAGSLLRNVLFVAIYCAALGGTLRRWWNPSWDSEPGKTRVPGTVFLGIAAVATALAAAGGLLASAAITIESGTATLAAAALVSALAWAKWLLVLLLLVALILTGLSWSVRLVAWVYRRARDTKRAEDYVPEQFDWAPDGRPGQGSFSVSLSGGGIRSAAFSMGALSALEDFKIGSFDGEPPQSMLRSAALLATVSGGGYAGTAWRIAAGTAQDPSTPEEQSLIGNPNLYVPTAAQRFADQTPQDDGPPLFQRVRERRAFLRNGRGGMAASLIQTLLQLALHIGIVLWSVGIVAWLVGRFIGSWAITTGAETGTLADDAIEYSRLIRPAGWALAAFVAFAIPRLFLHDGPGRKRWDALAGFWLFVAVALATGLVAVPWMVVELLPAIEQILPGGAGPQSTVALALSGGVAASVWRVLQAPIKSRALYLGGVFLAISLTLFAMLVASEAINPPSNLVLFPDSYVTWGLAIGGFVLALAILNPELWSLHPIYARLIRGTFGNRLVDGEWEELEHGHWPRLSAYRGAPGPQPLICAAAARNERDNTGLRVVSMTFEPDCVTLHQGPSARGESNSRAIDTEKYEAIFNGRAGSNRLQSILGYTAVSAAALAPSLGRLSLGSTNALIAALNMRLGVWLPNPDYEDGTRRIGPHMINMYKELTGSFGIEEPNVYVTDGGHWENMAMVELIRRRAKVVIAVDASADQPYSFKIFQEAIELARLECGAHIRFVDGHGIAEMRPGDRSRPVRNWAIATIDYADGSTGRLLFIKAQSSDAMPLDILRFAKEDPDFPNYSTANQMLSDKEFSHMAVLGRESMVRAVNEHFEWLFKDFTFADHRSTDAADAGSAARITANDQPAPAQSAPSEPWHGHDTEIASAEPLQAEAWESASTDEWLSDDAMASAPVASAATTAEPESVSQATEATPAAPARVFLQVAPRPRDTPTAAQGTGGLISASDAELT